MAVVPLKSKSVALDTSVMMDLAAEDEDAAQAVKVIGVRLKGTKIIITPTVIQELAYLSESENEEVRDLATLALRDARARWGISPTNCDPQWHGVIELAAKDLRDRDIIPYDEVSDALIVAEAGLAQCSMLLSSDGHIFNANNTKINEVLFARDLGTILISTPWKIAKQFSP